MPLVHLLRAVTVELSLVSDRFAALHGLHPTDLRALIHLLDADRAGLRARLLSASYLPRAGTAEADAMLNEADELFDRHAEGDVVTIIYRVDQYLGRPAA